MEQGPSQRPDQIRKDKIDDVLIRLFRLQGDESEKEIATRAEALRKKYPNYKQYRIYHDLLGSSPSKSSEIIYDDFPGEDSVEKFIDYLEKKYLSDFKE